MKKLNETTINFNLETPSYAEIIRMIMNMKSSASLLERRHQYNHIQKMSNIANTSGKNSTNCMEKKTFLKIWRSGVTVLAHKKDDFGKPVNFRPITLQPVLSKVFTSLIRNRLYIFATDNRYIETNIKKVFWEKIPGCFEHIETQTHMINNARIKQRCCVITLLDLKNAFGEVNHSLLVETLKIYTYLIILLPSSHLYIRIIQSR